MGESSNFVQSFGESFESFTSLQRRESKISYRKNLGGEGEGSELTQVILLLSLAESSSSSFTSCRSTGFSSFREFER